MISLLLYFTHLCAANSHFFQIYIPLCLQYSSTLYCFFFKCYYCAKLYRFFICHFPYSRSYVFLSLSYGCSISTNMLHIIPENKCLSYYYSWYSTTHRPHNKRWFQKANEFSDSFPFVHMFVCLCVTKTMYCVALSMSWQWPWTSFHTSLHFKCYFVWWMCRWMSAAMYYVPIFNIKAGYGMLWNIYTSLATWFE